MAPRGIAILLGAGPNVGSGIARILANPAQGNLAVALLARDPEKLSSLTKSLEETSNGGILHSFPTDTTPDSLRKTFAEIQSHSKFKDLPLHLAIFNIKHSHKIDFLHESSDAFGSSLQTYVTGAMVFGQEASKWMLAQYPTTTPSNQDQASPLQKKGTIIFTGTLGALRTNAGYAAYGAGRSGVRMLAQSMARELSSEGIHVVHTIINGGVKDVREAGDSSEEQVKVLQGKTIKAESVGKTYLWLMEQGVDLWTHELDLRPAAERF